MKMIPYYVLTSEEYFTVRRIRHLLGYELPDGSEERKAEVAAAGCLFRKNDPFRTDHYEAAYDALVALRKRLVESVPRWRDEEGYGAQVMADERAVQAAEVQRALDALPHPSTLVPMPDLDEKYAGI